jgi:hypothetical protein
LASLVKIGSVVSEISKGDISIFRRPQWRRIDLLNTIFKEDSSSKVWLNCPCGFGDLEYCRPKRSLLLSSRSRMHLNVSWSRAGNSLIRSLFKQVYPPSLWPSKNRNISFRYLWNDWANFNQTCQPRLSVLSWSFFQMSQMLNMRSESTLCQK